MISAGDEARDAALALVEELPQVHVFRLTIFHVESVCDGGRRSCKKFGFPDLSWAAVSSNDPDVIRSWDWSKANGYGIDCGKTGWAVVDVDPGASWPFNGTRTHQSGRGSHYIYEDPVGVIGLEQHLDPWGIDVRGVGGFIVGPGSWHPHGEYVVLTREKINTPPVELYEATKRTPRQRFEAGELPPLSQLEALPRLESCYRQMSEAVEGERNGILNKMAYSAAGVWVRIPDEERTGIFTEDHIKQKLYDSIYNDENPTKSWDTINRGWEDGLSAPMPDREESPPVSLSTGFFDAHPVLDHIRQAAYKSGGNPEALLGAVLARVIAEVPVRYVLPGAEDGGIHSRSSLNLGVALAGFPGSGKSTAADRSDDVLGVDQTEVFKGGAATGQGLMQAYFVLDGKKNVMVDDPRRIFFTDEVKQFEGLTSGKDTTLLADLTAMLMGGTVGSPTATEERRRNLPRNTYRMVHLMGVQPINADCLLRHEDTGFPQRYLWVAVDKRLAIPPEDRKEMDWPGSIDWPGFPAEDFMGESGEVEVVRFPKTVLDQIAQDDYENPTRGDALVVHLNILRMKVAAALMFLFGDREVGDLVWDLAGVLVDKSLEVQKFCRGYMAERTREAGQRRMEAEMEMQDKAADRMESARLLRIVARMERLAVEAGGELVPRKKAMSPRDKPYEEDALVLVDEKMFEIVEYMERGRDTWGIRLRG